MKIRLALLPAAIAMLLLTGAAIKSLSAQDVGDSQDLPPEFSSGISTDASNPDLQLKINPVEAGMLADPDAGTEAEPPPVNKEPSAETIPGGDGGHPPVPAAVSDPGEQENGQVAPSGTRGKKKTSETKNRTPLESGWRSSIRAQQLPSGWRRKKGPLNAGQNSELKPGAPSKTVAPMLNRPAPD